MYARRLANRSPTVCRASGPRRPNRWSGRLNTDDLKVFSKSIIDSRKNDLDKVIDVLDTIGKQETENTKKILELHDKFIKKHIFCEEDSHSNSTESVDFIIIDDEKDGKCPVEEDVNDDYFEK